MYYTMYDSVDPSTVPSNAQAIAGYTAGNWPTYYTFERDYPTLLHQHRLVPIAVQAYDKGRFLDIENGDATPQQAAGWFKSSNVDHADGKPGIYCSASVVNTVVGAMSAAGIPRSAYLVWSAHYSTEHICGVTTNCGYPKADLTQWTDHALGRNLDQSLVSDYVFLPNSHPPAYPIDRFVDYKFQAPWEWGYHPLLSRIKRINERDTVKQYLKLRTDPQKNSAQLSILSQELLFLRKRVWYVANTERINTSKIHNKPSWGVNWRGWRWGQLYNWTKDTKAWWTHYETP